MLADLPIFERKPAVSGPERSREALSRAVSGELARSNQFQVTVRDGLGPRFAQNGDFRRFPALAM